MRRFLLSLFVLVVGAAVLLSSGAASSKMHARKASSFGEYAVRFKPGTPLAAMTAAIKAARGVVIEDMHQISALGAASTDRDFVATLTANPLVAAVFVDGVGPTAVSQLGGSGGATTATAASGTATDPLHDALQWDDQRMNVPAPTPGANGSGVKVAVIDSGVDATQRETAPSVLGQTKFIPCDALSSVIGKAEVFKYLGSHDCDSQDNSGHGTWIASRIAGALNGFASNGIAPAAKILDEKALAQTYGFDSMWVVSAMLDACDKGANVLNLSLYVYNDPTDFADAQDYLLWVDAVAYCRARGSTIVAALGNEHVRVDRVNTTVAGRALAGVGLVSSGPDGVGLTGPGEPLNDLRGLLVAPAGVPGVIAVSASGNVIADGTGAVADPWRFPAGLTDQLAYYSSYGSRVDIAAPGGARAYNVPDYDATSGNVFTQGYGILGATDPSAELCGKALGTGCFKLDRNAFMYLQGTSMSAADVSGAIALLLSAKPALRGKPDAILARLASTARRNMSNAVGPMSPVTGPTAAGECTTGFCHIDRQRPIAFADAYGAGIVDLSRALR
ncbi:MAG: hypothetical protein QOE29_2464 [Gaiellaceae bacterium]|nr:hypothetical protein [Gaiellaceae bacterium]